MSDMYAGDARYHLEALRQNAGSEAEYIDAIWKSRERDQDARNSSIKIALSMFVSSQPVKNKIDVTRLPTKLKVASAR